MKSVTLKIEAIGMYMRHPYGGLRAKLRNDLVKCPWVAEIKDYDDEGDFKFIRSFLTPLVDYSEANSICSRGVYFYFHLFPGKIYEIYQPETWKRKRRYFAEVIDGKIHEITEKEVCKWINNI